MAICPICGAAGRPRRRTKPIRNGDVLSRRELNRALLARQLLLERAKLPALKAVERLAGLQAQSPAAPYYALWARLESFRQEELAGLLVTRQAVRIALMRSTIHLVSAEDCRILRPLLQLVLERGLNGAFGKRLAGTDAASITALGRAMVEAEPLPAHELGRRLSEAVSADPEALAAAVRTYVPLVQLPPRGLWGESGMAVHTTAEAWLGRPLLPGTDPEELVRRYLAAFGPASVRDMQVWSGLTRLRDAFERLRPQLAVFRDEHGRELLDLPDAPRPGGDMTAPARFLGEFDNMLLSYEDRSRLLAEGDKPRVFTKNGIIRAVFLLDGFAAGTWSIAKERGRAVLTVKSFMALSHAEEEALAAEGRLLLAFAEPGLVHEIVFAAPAA